MPFEPYADGNPKHIDVNTVEKYTLKDYDITPDRIKELMFGVPVTDPNTGKALPESFYDSAIRVAVAKAEKKFDVVVLPRFQVEEKDMFQNDASSYMFLRMNHKPVLQVEQLSMEFQGRTVINYPAGWWKVSALGGSIQLLPTFGSRGNNMYPYSGEGNMTPFLGLPQMQTGTYAPQMFRVGYVAGMLPISREGSSREWEMAPDFRMLILKHATKEIFQIWGRLIIGAGIASKSLSIDGMSETIVTTQSAMYGGAQADIMQIDRDIAELEDGLRSTYGIQLGII